MFLTGGKKKSVSDRRRVFLTGGKKKCVSTNTLAVVNHTPNWTKNYRLSSLLRVNPYVVQLS